MKKTYNFLMSVAVAAMAFIGCTNTEISIDNNPAPAPAPVEGTYHQLTFAADSESDASRTHHTGETIYWSKGDRIRIGYTRDGVWQDAKGNNSKESAVTAKLYASSEAHEDAELAKFRVTILFKDTELEGEHIFYGLYPSEITKNNAPDFADNTNSGTINVYLPYIQSPTATSFDPKADLLVSKSLHTYDRLPIATKENEETGTPEREGEEISMRWKRLVAHGQITLKNLLGEKMMVEGEKISFVEFTVDEGVNLTGDFILDIAGQTITPNGSKNNKVRLSFAENTEYNTLIDADNDGTKDDFVVWFATAPFTTVSLNVKVGTDKAIYTRSIANANKTLKFKVNTRSTLGINMASPDTTREPLPAWELLTDINDLKVGNFVVIAAADYDVAMSSPSNNGNNRTSTDITKSETKNTITIDSDVQVLTVGKGTTDGTWSLYDEDKFGFLYAASDSDNQLKTKSTLDEDGSWTIEVVDGKASVVSVGKSDTHGTMRYNANKDSELFSCYQASNQMKDIALYHNATALEQLAKPEINYALEVEGNAVKVEWEEVPNAIYYTVRCQKENTDKVVIFKNITDTAVVCDNLTNTTDKYPHWIITVTAYADGYYSNTSDAVEATVEGKTPTVTVEPTELSFTSAGGENSIKVSTTNLGNSVEIDAVSNNDAFDVSVEGTTVTVVAEANPTTEPRSGIITITARGAMTIACNVAVSQEAKPEGEGTNATDVINREFTGVASTQTYSAWSDKTGASGAVYAGQSAGDKDAVQLRSKNNNSGIIVTKSAGKVSKVTVTWNSDTADGRTLNIYGKKSAYSAVTDLYNDSTSGELLGTIVKGTSTELAIEGDYAFIGLRSASGAMYLTEIRVVWGDGGDAPAPLTPLATPEVTATAEGNTISVSWTIVPNADSYTVTCGETKQTVNTNNATFEGLSYNTEYVISVVANPAANSTEYYASEPGTASATTEADPNAGGSGDSNAIVLTGENMAAMTNAGTTYNNEKTYTDGTYTWTTNGYQDGTKNMIQLRVRTHNSGVSWIKLPTFAAPIKDIKFSVTSASATSEGANQTDTRLYYQETNTKDAAYISFGGTATNEIVMDLSDKSYTTGYITANAGIRIWKITVTLQGEGGGGDTPATTPLKTPTLTATAMGNQITVMWGAITGAKDYTVTCGTEEKTVTGTSAEFTDLEYETKYDVTVVANPASVSTNTKSEAGTTSATTEADPNAGGGGENIELVFNTADYTQGISAYDKSWEHTYNGKTWSIANFNNNNKAWAYIKCGSKKFASVASIATKFAIETAVKSVTVTVDAVTTANVNSTYLQVATDADFSNIVETVNVTIAKGNVVYNITNPQANCYYKLVYNCKLASNGSVQISKVVYSAE